MIEHPRFIVVLEERPGVLPRRRWVWVLRDTLGQEQDWFFRSKNTAQRWCDDLNGGGSG